MSKWEFLREFALKELKTGEGITIADIARRAKVKFNLDQDVECLRKAISRELNNNAVELSKIVGDDLEDDRPNEPLKEEASFDKDSSTLTACGNGQIRTIEELLKAAQVNEDIWNVDRSIVNKWDVTTAEGKTFTNWQVKAFLSKRQEIEDALVFEDFFKELLAKHDPYKYKPVIGELPKEENLLEVNIFDLHLGKLCWSEEVNNNYDLKIASERFKYALKMLITRAGAQQFERILFPVGNDFFNSDNDRYTTTLGTSQHDDSRWQKTFKTGGKLLVEAIDYLRQFAPVDVVVIPGNHDMTKTFFLGEFLSAWYRNDGRVTVDNAANVRKYYEYGNVLLGFTHGDKEKHEALRSLMAYESKEAWARTKYKEFHLGHQHRKLTTKHVVKSDLLWEELGVVIRSMASITGTDAWHHQHGYLGPTKAAEAFLWNKEEGLLGQFTVNMKK